MIHPLVRQLWFTRSEFKRCFESLSEGDGQRRLEPSNSLSWIVGHLANQENLYWVYVAQNISIEPDLRKVGYGMPASTPSLTEMWTAWQHVTETADHYLENLTGEMLTTHFLRNGKPVDESVGTLLQRNIYHYWYHIGEAQVIRQQLGHQNLPDFVGNMEHAAYQPEA